MTLDEQINDARLTEAAERIRWTAGLESLAARWERISSVQERRVKETRGEVANGHYNSALSYEACAKSLRAEIEQLSNGEVSGRRADDSELQPRREPPFAEARG